MKIKYGILFTTLILGGLAQAQQQEQAPPAPTQQPDAKRLEDQERPATATMQPTKGNQARGTVTFTPTDEVAKVKVEVHLSQLKPGSVHGLHMHEKGDCSASDASSAGGHFNPSGKPHGDRAGAERHAGDLGNVEASSAGEVSATFDVEGINVGAAPNGVIGKSVILHAKADDLKSQPSGNSGDRIACGVINFQTKETRSPRL
ncbi:MAG: superoxide dismutase family protein [Burkholderiales bacterium]